MVALAGGGDEARAFAVALLTRLRDRAYDPGAKRRASVLALVDRALIQILDPVFVYRVTQPGGMEVSHSYGPEG
jgi:hypothetical protein